MTSVISLVGYTRFNAEIAEDITGFEPDDYHAYEGQYGGSYLAEFAGRACYGSWDKPNPATATNEAYLRHIQEVKHTSVMEHGSASFYIQHVSRSLTHELIRHRVGMSYSQQSQRYVKADKEQYPVIPPLYVNSWEWDKAQSISETQGLVENVWNTCVSAYADLVDIWEERLGREGIIGTEQKKRAREAARCVLPNMTPTAITVTGNHTAWRHFLLLRGSTGADAEIREMAVCLYGLLSDLEPNLYQDIKVWTNGQGESFLTTEG